MPRDNGIWLDDEQCAFPYAEDVLHDTEEKPIGMFQSRLSWVPDLKNPRENDRRDQIISVFALLINTKQKY
jgi:hypothetical protein